MIRQSKIVSLLSLLIITFCFAACQKENEEEITTDNNLTNGLYVLCEGLFGHNNSALDFYSFSDSTTKKDLFSSVNFQGLGETANDMIRVGDEIWIAVDGSAMVVVVDTKDGKIEKMIPIVDNSQNKTKTNATNREPRSLVSDNNFVYVSCFDGNIVKISIKDKSIKDIINTGGRNPEGIAIAENKIYVANSGGLSYPNYDNTVSVIDIESFKLEKLIIVMDNPQVLKSYGNKIFVVSTGDYTQTYRLTVIENSEKVDSLDINITDFAINDGFIYYVYKSWNDNTATLNKIDLNNLHSTPTAFATIPKELVQPYRIDINKNTIYVCDVKDYKVSGEVFAFDLSGSLLYSFSTSINPNTIIDIRN